MKKLLSLILATAMVLSLIPAAFAAEGEEATAKNFTIKYDLSQAMYELGMTSKSATNQPTSITYDFTNGFFKYDGSFYSDNKWNTSATSFFYPTGSNKNPDSYNVVMRSSRYIIFEVLIPVAGTYTMKVDHGEVANSDTYNYYMDVSYKSENATELIPLGGYDCETAKTSTTWTTISTSDVTTADSGTTEVPATFTVPNPGKYIFKFVTDSSSYRASVGTFYLISGDGNGAVLMPYYNGETALEVGDTASLKGYKSSDASETAVSYSVTGDAVSVDEETGIITAEKAGTATVTMTATDASITTAKTYSVDITVEDAETDFVTIAIDDDGDGYATVMSDVALGSTVKAVAATPENMVFRGWVRGSADNGHLVWTEPEYTFTATTHTYLTAIYTPVNAAATDEYYHWNGQFLGNDRTKAEANISPIVGYTFAKSWTEAKKENSITSWIANFTKNDTDYTVTVGNDGFSISKADDKYDTEVTCTSDNAVYWYRDNKLVDYGTEYKFFIWDNTTVKTSNEGHNGAKLMLDKKKDNTYMVEYDAGDAKLLEVGILFGDEGSTPTVDVCEEKMSSQRSLNDPGHGQFSATAEEYTVARGYLIYKDGDTYRVIYAD